MPHSESWDELEFFLRSDSAARALYMSNYNMDLFVIRALRPVKTKCYPRSEEGEMISIREENV